MLFGFSDDEKILRKATHDLFRRHAPVSEVRKVIERQAVAGELQALIGQQGLLSVLAGDSDGQSGAERSGLDGVLMAICVLEEAGRVLLPFPLIEGIIGAHLLSRDPSQAELCEAVVDGSQLLSVAWVADGPARLRQAGDGLVAEGRFFGAPFAACADVILAFFDGPAPGQSSLVRLDPRHPAVTVRPEQGMDGSMPLDRVEVAGLTLSGAQIVVAPGDADALRQQAQTLGALFTAAELVGLSEEVLRASVDYTKVRKQFGQEIGRFQAIKHMAADMYLLAESARVAVIYAGWAVESGTEPEAVSVAKAYAADAATEITGQAIQMHGGIGFTWDSDLHLYFKRARRSASSFGDAYAHRERVLDALLARGGPEP